MRINWTAARTSALLSILFLVVYGATNLLASLRSDVPSFHFDWEHNTPFVPLIFVPYISIDLLFVAAPFLCRTDRRRRTLANRLAAATILGGLCFLLFPLRFAFERPPVAGLLGKAFDLFRQMDQPFNQCPSLHVALASILLGEYLRFVQDRMRNRRALAATLAAATWLWFTLIILAAVLTWQHHVIDVAGGFALAALCCYLFQDRALRQPAARNVRIAAYYGAGAVLAALIAFAAKPWSLLLLLPAVALCICSAAYIGLGPGIYRKQDGRIPPLTWLFLWPVLLGQRVSLAHYRRRGAAWNALTPQVLIGRRLDDAEARLAVDQGVTATLDLTGEFAESTPFLGVCYLNIPILDLTAPTHDQLARAADFIDRHANAGKVYIHCKLGYSRTAAVAGHWLLRSGRARTADEAVAALRAARSGIIIRTEALASLRASAVDAAAQRASVIDAPATVQPAS